MEGRVLFANTFLKLLFVALVTPFLFPLSVFAHPCDKFLEVSDNSSTGISQSTLPINLGIGIFRPRGRGFTVILPDKSSRTGKGTVSDHARQLSKEGKLIKQRDRSLRDLILPRDEGGLCTSACGENLLHIMVSYLGGNTASFVQNKGAVVREINREIGERSQIDTRFGLDINYMPATLIRMAKLYYGFDLQASKVVEGSKITTDHFVPKANEAILAAFYSQWSSGKKDYDSHAIMILGLDKGLKSIIYIDPLNPRLILESPFEFWTTSSGQETIRLNFKEVQGRGDDVGAFFALTRYKVPEPLF